MSAPNYKEWNPKKAAQELARKLRDNVDAVLVTRFCLYRTQDLINETETRTTQHALARAMKDVGFITVSNGAPCPVESGEAYRLWIVRKVDEQVRRSQTAGGRYYDEERK
jgi:hypothetical protein